jgi:4-amino-4-deoxy-L-arabinose transferase-like glycosyltransferase
MNGRTPDRVLSHRRARIAMGVSIVVYLVVVATASRRLSPTYDEPIHLRNGMAMLTHGRFIDVEKAPWTAPDPLTPPADALFALAGRAGGLPEDFRATTFVDFQPILAARWVSHLLGAAMLLVCFVWGRRLWGEGGGLTAALLLALNPLFLAHATIVSTDLTGAAGGLLAAWALWRIWLDDASTTKTVWQITVNHRVVERRRGFLGMGLVPEIAIGAAVAGLAVAAKIINLVFLVVAPVVVVWGVWRARRRGEAWGMRGLAAGGATLAAALLFASAIHGWMDLYDDRPVPMFGTATTFHMSHELAVCAQLAADLPRIRPDPVYYKGWLQAPSMKHALAGLVYKTPLPLAAMLLLGAAAAMDALRKRRPQWSGIAFIFILGVGLTLFLTTRGAYLGLRQLLFPLTLAAVLAGRLGQTRNAECGARNHVGSHIDDSEDERSRVSEIRNPKSKLDSLRIPNSAFRIVFAVLLLWNVAIVGYAYPWYPSYFNPLAGDRLVLVDSDRDWGQGLIALAEWQREHSPDEPIWLAYFGPSRPQDFGVRYRGLLSPIAPGVELDPNWADGPDPERLDGPVAISTTYLAGLLIFGADQTPDYYAKWWKLEPKAKIAGQTIWIYERSE